MNVQAEISLYPLGEKDIGPRIEKFISGLAVDGIEVQAGPMSTIISGGCEAVFAVIAQAYEKDINSGRSVSIRVAPTA